MESPSRRRWVALIASRVPYYLGVPLSLLIFPSSLPWVILAWGVVHAVLLSQKKRPWVPLVVALVLVPLKRPDVGHWFLLQFAIISGMVVLATKIKQRRAPSAWTIPVRCAPLVGLGFVIAFLIYIGDLEQHRGPLRPLRPERPIIVIGDSLSVHGWPRELSSQVSVPVIDRSEGGINTIEGLNKLPEALSLKPGLVVIELGGHDYLENRGRAATRDNLEKMIRMIRAADAEVLLFEIPRGFVYDPYRCLERELARKFDLELITDGAIRQLVLFSPFTPIGSLTGRKLSDDGLHPNDAGHRFLAERVKQSLVTLYGTSILAAPR